jgi:hypothetical protein
MKKLKILAVALGAVAITSSALATPTLVIWDTGGSSATVLAAPTGLASFASVSFDGAWSVVITTSETKPALGSATAPAMDLNVQATSLGLASRNLHVSWSDDAFGPFNSSLVAKLTGHVVSGTGAGVQYQTFYQAGAGVWNTAAAPSWTLSTDSGVLPPPTYASTLNGAINQASFGLTEYVTIASSPGGSYSLDASIGGLPGVPDGGTTVMLLGAALSGLACLRRKMA